MWTAGDCTSCALLSRSSTSVLYDFSRAVEPDMEVLGFTSGPFDPEGDLDGVESGRVACYQLGELKGVFLGGQLVSPDSVDHEE